MYSRLLVLIPLLCLSCEPQRPSDPFRLTFSPTQYTSLSIEAFRFVGSTTTVQQVVEKIGPPERNIASGVAILEYTLEDGSHIWIWSSDLKHIGAVMHGTTNVDTSEILYEEKSTRR